MDVSAILDGLAIVGGNVRFYTHGDERVCEIEVAGADYTGASPRSERDRMYTEALRRAVKDMLDRLIPAMSAFPEQVSRATLNDERRTEMLHELAVTQSETIIAWLVEYSGYSVTKAFESAHGHYLASTGYWDR